MLHFSDSKFSMSLDLKFTVDCFARGWLLILIKIVMQKNNAKIVRKFKASIYLMQVKSKIQTFYLNFSIPEFLS